ncbi:MAG: magnesium chelatase subunit D [Litoreibacter sp.]|nr:magnesium chelatase subunit D [Litoreibacter sp.]
MTAPSQDWQNATLALTLLAVDPSGLAGIMLRARSGPARDRFIAALGPALSPRALKRIHPGTTDDQLFGGLDLTATLDRGEAVLTEGLFGDAPSAFLLTMAERCPPGLTARIARAMDTANGHALIALDEGIDDEAPPEALADRLAFHIDLNAVTHRDCPEIILDSDRIEIARNRLQKVSIPAEFIANVTKVGMQLGIGSLRAPNFVLRAARTLAAIQKQDIVTQANVTTAAALVFGPRATMLPEDPQQDQTESPSNEPEQDTEQGKTETVEQIPEEILLQAVAASLPKDFLDRIKDTQSARTAQGSGGSGAARKGNRRGRPKPSQRGQLGSAARIDLIATLRAAAPWQSIRKQAAYAPQRNIHIRASDIRLKKFEEKSDRLLIFAVDASGSAALARLAEAKGAVELLLAEAYARRDHVALIAFRGTKADLLLPPTRSLVQTKRRLSSLPGGGGTPLAAGLEAALLLAESTRTKGLTPTIAVLTDGRANIALDGTASRISASEDARTVARQIRARQTPALVIDTGNRPQGSLQDLARELSAPYLPLPRADAHKVSQAIEAVLE